MSITEGHIVLIAFPNTDLSKAKMRPALLLKKLQGDYNDWLICLISTKLFHKIQDFDEVIDTADPDYQGSGLKQKSLIRISRLAIANQNLFSGSSGYISKARLEKILDRLSKWTKDK